MLGVEVTWELILKRSLSFIISFETETEMLKNCMHVQTLHGCSNAATPFDVFLFLFHLLPVATSMCFFGLGLDEVTYIVHLWYGRAVCSDSYMAFTSLVREAFGRCFLDG